MGKDTAPQPPRPLTWLGDEWEPTSWLHPAWVAAGAYAAAEVAHLANVSPWYAGAFTIAAGTAGLLATGGARFGDAARAFMTGAGIAVGGWLTWVCATSPFNTPSIVAAVVGTMLATATYPGMRHAQRQHEERARAFRQRGGPAAVVVEPASDDRPGEPRQWERFMAKVGLKGLTFLERVPNRAGFAVRFRLPRDGSITWTAVAGASHKIEVALERAHEGMVRVEQGTDQQGRPLAAEVLVHFDVRDVLTETIDMPDEHSPLSIKDAFPIGCFTDGEPICLTLREIATLIVGLRGRGKTNLFNVLVHQLSRCVDVCLWGIDLKGGRAIKPWLQPWLSGKVKRPVFDWVATTRAEAHLMLKGALGLIADRGEQGAGGSKIEPSRQQPAVLILCDEVAALTGQHSGPRFRSDGEGPTSRDFSADITLGIQLGRSEAVDYVLITQRSTVSMTGGGDLKSQCEQRIGLGVSNAQDARSIFEDDPVAAKLVSQLKGKGTRGSLMVRRGEGRTMLAKGFFYGDGKDMLRRVEAAAVAHAELPAPLDKRGQRAVEAAVRKASGGKHGYVDRWDRGSHLYSDGVPPEVTDADLDAMDQAEPTTPTTGGATAVKDRRTHNRFFPSRKQQPAESEPVVESAPSSVPDPDWERIIESFNAPAVQPQPATEPEPDPQARMVAIVDDAGERGISPGSLLVALQRDGIAPDARTTIYRWLNKALDDGLIVQPGGRRGLYYTPRNLR